VVGVVAGWTLLVQAVIAPPIRHRVTWFALSERELEIQHGWFVVSRSVVPMNRVQYLQVERGPLARRFRLANLHVHTAGGMVPLRGMDDPEAERVRTRISALAHLEDDL
jgi:membrane protein YdbS with pleckstrin-like domain